MVWFSERAGSASKNIYGGILVVGTGSPVGGKVATPQPEGYGSVVRGVAHNNRPSNKGLEQTGSAANGLSGPCSSTRCYAGVPKDQQGRS